MNNLLEKQFSKVVEEKMRKSYETKEERLARIARRLGIPEHGNGKRKKRTKKKGGRK